MAGATFVLALALLVLAGCGTATRTGDDLGPGGLQCVPYARQVSGIDIRGDAWTWWESAAGLYPRGFVPEPGAVLVMQPTSVMPLGHVAVVQSVKGAREILVTQANWGSTPETRGRVESDTSVVDVSLGNDWRAVRVWNRSAGAYGRVNPAFGFIYARRAEAAGSVGAVPGLLAAAE
jgi:hypothetical protein